MGVKKQPAINGFPRSCVAAGLPEPIAEYRFHPVRRWRVDYFFPTLNLAVEIEGGAWVNGRHTRAQGFSEDMRKYNALAMAGIALLRFTPAQMASFEAIATILEYVSERERAMWEEIK